MRIFFFIFLISLGFSLPAAADAEPGDSCATYPDGSFMISGGPELSGTVYFLSCVDDVWEMAETNVNPATCDLPGDICADDMVYVGTDGGVDMYAMPCDLGQTWDGSSCLGSRSTLAWGSFGTVRGTNSTSNGEANTNTLAGFGASAHPAAYACANSTLYGHDDWYLPAQNELNSLEGVKSIGVFSGTFASQRYWSSSENANTAYDDDFARDHNIGTDAQDTNWKSDNLYVRCVRK